MAEEADGCGIWLVMRAELKSTIAVIADEARRFRRSHDAWLAAVASQGRLVERSERRIAEATGGLRVDQWDARRRRRRVNSAADSRAVARAVRAEAEVWRAVTDAHHVRATGDDAVRTARADLASAARALLRYGPLGERFAGVGLEELRHLARPPSADRS
jgi:hypothetical protein